LDCLSLLEAGLDFSDQTIEFLSADAAIARLTDIKEQLESLLHESGRLASVIDLPAVGIAGSPNAGKSSLMNRLLGRPRSIVSPVRKTTRDVLSGELTLQHCRCVLFDCAGLVTLPAAASHDARRGSGAEGVLEQLAQRAAIEALRNSSAVIFCVDISKEDWSEDISVQHLINKRTDDRRQMTEERGAIDGRPSSVVRPQSSVIPAATKCDLVPERQLAARLSKLHEIFGYEFLPISSQSGAGVESLRDTVDKKLIKEFKIPRESGLALTARHRQAVTESIENIDAAIKELKAGQDEVAAMMLRAALHCINDIEQAGNSGVDEKILQKIFSRFCIGK
jgi:tRNA modification GTPase